MANQKHLDILKQGVEAWNAWRGANPRVVPDLGGADLRWARLSEAHLFEADLRAADLSGADLSGADLSWANLSWANLSGADLSWAHLSWAHLSWANLSEANLNGARLSEANLNGADLHGADLPGADLRAMDLSGADLIWAHLGGVYLDGVYLGGTGLMGANLRGAKLSAANLMGAILHEANLMGANLMGANLMGANLRGADLRGTDLSGADLSGANLAGAHLSRACIGSTIFGAVDLRGVNGLETVIHRFPSTIGIDTLYASGGHIPETFLRGCGVPDSFIDYIPSLIGALQPVQFYSCFISYSAKDEDFAKRLHERMRAEHLRVWFAPEDIKGGEKLYDQIDRAIQLHDRLLLVLSEQSIQSEWVMTEIRRARRAEQKEQRRKLFPIRLTSYDTLRDWECLDADSGKDLAVEVREYFIPDFMDWKDHDAFEAAFKRLLSDLKASERA